MSTRKLPKALPHFTLRIGGSSYIPAERSRDGIQRYVDSLHLARTWRTRVRAEKFAESSIAANIELGLVVAGEFSFLVWIRGGQMSASFGEIIGEYVEREERHE